MPKKVLVIDDEEDFCKMVKLNLELSKDFKVETAIDGENGIRAAKKIKPDIIILDLMMPKISGFEVLETLKKDANTASIPVIILTAKEDYDSQPGEARLPRDRYLIKPIDAPTLRKKIEEIITRKGAV